MYINGSYQSLADYLGGSSKSDTTSNVSSGSLAGYMNSESDEKSTYFSDTVKLSAEAIAVLREKNPEFLESLGYSLDAQTDLISSSSGGTMLDKAELSAAAYAALRESDPSLLEAMGYDTDTDTGE